MNTTQAWISFLQVQVAATGVILIAAGLAPLFAKRQIVARAWLWQCALLGVLSSLLVPLYGRIVPIRGPQLAILPAIESRSDQAIAQGSPAFATVTASTASPEALASGPVLDKPTRMAASALQTRSDPEFGAASPDQAVVSSEPGPSSSSSLSFNTSTPGVSSGGPAIWNRLGLAILLVWLGGMLFHLARGIRGLIVCHRISVASIPLDHSHFDTLLTRLQRASGRKFPLPVSATSLINSPVVVGILKPQILLPVDALEWMSPAQLFQVLLHETAHVVRRDPLINAVQRITRILFWHHPLVGWMNRQLSLSREDVCDNFVLMHTEAADYAETLLEMTQRCPRLLALPGLAMLPESGSLEERVVSLLDDDRDRSLSWRRWPRLTVATALLVVPVLSGLVRVTRITTQAQEPPRVAASPADKSAKVEAVEPVPPIGVDKAADATPAASSHSGQISGKVIFDRDGSIAAAATVILLPPPPAGQNVYIGLLPLKQTTADAEGQFSFKDLPDGRYRVWANRDRQTSRVKRNGGAVVIIENGQPTTPVELKLIDGVTVTVNIANKETGKTIPDATVHLGWSDLLGDFHAAGDAPVIVSPLTPERWFFEVWAEGYAKESQWLNLENAQDAALKFQLGQGGSLEGTVVDAAGKPVDDVGVSIRHEGDRQQYGWGKTDKAGRYKFEHLPLNARLTLSVSKTDYQRQEAGVIVTQARQTLDLKILFRPDGGTVFGTVKNKEGRPVAGATLTNTGSSSDDVRETKTDSQGRYRLENLYPGVPKPSVVVRAAGFAPKRVEIEPGPAESPAEVVITLDPGHRIRGRVTDEGGRGLDDVTIYFAQGNNPFTTGGKGKTGKDGHFEFDSLPAKCKFIFQKTGYSTIDNQELALDTNRVIDVQMSEVGVIVGKVTDGATGKPIRAFNVRITFSPKRESGEPNNGLPTDLIDPGQAYQSEAGRFLLDSLVSRMPLQVMIDAGL